MLRIQSGLWLIVLMGTSATATAQVTEQIRTQTLNAAATATYPGAAETVLSTGRAERQPLTDGRYRARLGAEHLNFTFLPALRPAGNPPAEASLLVDDARLAGADPLLRMRLFSPDPVQPGSSLSHWDPIARPNLLMEPAINPDLGALDLDITPEQMFDIGWTSGASTFNVVSLDDPGVGLDDPRAFAGAPGNTATTLGEARRNLIEAALAVWGSTLASTVPIDVLVTYAPLPCQPGGGAVLGGALTIFVFSDGPGIPQPGTWYHSALAEALVGSDLSGPPAMDGGDIFVIINSDIDEECLGAGTGYYYGLDGNPPAGTIDFAPVVLHEAGHGLGFANFTDEETGSQFLGLPGIFDHFTHDLTRGKNWANMTDAERAASAINYGNVIWTGNNVTREAGPLLESGVPIVRISNEELVDGDYDAGTATFGPPLDTTPVTGPIACADDSTDEPLDACEALADDMTGQIALVRRGTCAFVTKAENAQAAGAAGMVVVNNAGNSPVEMAGVEVTPITIPVASMGRDAGEAVIDLVCFGILFGDGFE